MIKFVYIIQIALALTTLAGCFALDTDVNSNNEFTDSSLILSSVDEIKSNEEESSNIPFDSGVYFNKDWSDTRGNYSEAVIPDKETAVSVAYAVFKGIDKDEKYKNYCPQTIFFDEADDIWIVSFWDGTKGNTLGDCCSIAIQKSDGKVIRIWFEE